MTGGVIYAWESFMPLTPALAQKSELGGNDSTLESQRQLHELKQRHSQN